MLASKTGSNCFDGALRFLHGLRDTGEIVIHIRRDVKLQQTFQLGAYVFGGAFLFAYSDVVVRLDDFGQLVRQIILSPSIGTTPDKNTWSNVRWRDRQSLDDHPLGPGVVIRYADQVDILLGNVAENVQCHARFQQLLLGLRQFSILDVALIRVIQGKKLQAFFSDGGLHVATTTVAGMGIFGVFL